MSVSCHCPSLLQLGKAYHITICGMNPTYEYHILIFIERVWELIRFSPQAHAGSVTGLADEFYACGFESFTNKP